MGETWTDEEADVSEARLEEMIGPPAGDADADPPNPLLAAPPIDAALSMNVSLDAEHGLIRLTFNRPTGMVSMDPEAARSLVQALRECANAAEEMTGARRVKANGRGRKGRW